MDGVSLEVVARVAEMVVIAGGAFGLALKIGRAVERFELVGKMQGREINALKTEIGGLNTIVTTLAVHNEKYTNLDRRVTSIQETIDELRHGIGIVMPPNGG